MAYNDFIKRFRLLTNKNKYIVANTLSNIFSMRIIGNKTHGDLAEVGIVEFINQFMYDYKGIHVGKELYRAKEHEEDIVIENEITKEKFSVSLKAYGDGPLQISTDKKSLMFSYLSENMDDLEKKDKIDMIFESTGFKEVYEMNLMPLIYRENSMECNIMIFDFDRVKKETAKIIYKDKKSGKGRKHPIFEFVNSDGDYICEVRYGGASANALQRGLWTNTKRASNYFESATDGWIRYDHNLELVKLIMLALNSSKAAHEEANVILQNGIEVLKNGK